MASVSDYLEVMLLDHVLRNVAYTPPATVYLALYTAAPTDAGGGTEVTGGSYARQSAPFSATVSGTGRAANSSAITFSNMPAATVVAVGLFDAVTAGNLLFHHTLGTARTVVAGDNLTVAVGDLGVTMA